MRCVYTAHAAALIVLVTLLTVCFCLPACAGGNTIKNISVSDKGSCVEITVNSANSISLWTPKINSRYLAFDMSGSFAGTRSSVDLHSGGINSVSYGVYSSDPWIVRIAVGCSSGLRSYSVSYSNGNRCAVISIKKIGFETAGSGNSHSEKVQKSASASSEASLRALPSIPNESRRGVLVASTEPVRIPVADSRAIRSERSVSSNSVSLDFVGSDIQDVLKALAMQSGANIIAGPEVTGKVTVSLSNVNVEEALKLVTSMSGYKFANLNGTYIVGTPATIKAFNPSGDDNASDEKATETVTLRYADTAFIAKMIDTQFKGVEIAGKTSTDAKDSSAKGPSIMVLVGSRDLVKSAKQMVQSVEDSMAATAASEVTELYEVKYADIIDLAAIVAESFPGLKVTIGPSEGFNLKCNPPVSMKSSGSGGSGDSGSSASKGSDSSAGQSSAGGDGGAKSKAAAPPKILIMCGNQSDISKAKAMLAKLDIQQPQIMLEAKVIDISNDASKKLGIEWSWSDMRVEENTRDAKGTISAMQAPIGTVHLGRFDRTPVEISTTINAMISDGHAKVLAKPNVMALDGKPATIFIGDEVKYIVNIQQTPTGINVTVETGTVGIQLNSISRINSDGYITMNLHPEVSVISSWVNTPAGLTLPQISRRFVDGTIRVKNGETIVVGGLIREDERDTMSGVPILKDLPVLGALFRNRNKTKVHSEIMMFITPRILSAT